MNDENLVKISSTKEAREKGRNGGIKSGQTRRAKRDLKKCIQMALNNKALTGSKTVEQILGVAKEDATNRDAAVAMLFTKAIQGDLKALQMFIEYSGETEQEKRAQAQEKRAKKAFEVQMKAIDNLDKDNDNVMQFIRGMKENKVEADEELKKEEEKKHNGGGDTDGGNTEA